ncbi:phage tail assembly chaperone [Chengkuizengella sp. SCS-71B]|uniref:phage tail assembly chaperone n=1 Tax=Chengkuizengella sp. SCS-71B TaxID=3115290 RepID=UPI0032C24178
MSDLSLFFAENVSSELIEEVIISNRFKGSNGEPMAWKIKSMTEEENEQCRKAATRKVKAKNGVYIPETNQDEYAAKLAVLSIQYPNLKDAELQKSYGVMGAEVLLRKMLLPGEYSTLIQNVMSINGFNKDIGELIDEVKN